MSSSRTRLFRPLYIALFLYLLAGALEAGMIFARARGVISGDMASMGKKSLILFSTLSTVILLRWLIADTPFNFLRKYTVAPLLKSIITLFIYFGAAMTLLNQLFGINLKPLLTTSAVLTGVLALSLQETIKNLFTGIWINAERVVAKGDWVRIADKEGQIIEVTSRTTKLMTRENDCIYLPNRLLAEGILENYTYPTPLHIVEIDIGASYNDPPNKVKKILFEVAKNTSHVLSAPEPEVWTLKYSDFSIIYRLRVWINNFHLVPSIRSEINGMIWYAFKRNNVEIPFPVRTIQYKAGEKGFTEAMILDSLKEMDFLKPLNDDELRKVAVSSKAEFYGKGETIVMQGEIGETCYFVKDGSVEVMLTDTDGKPKHVNTLESGDFFGEMGLLAGEARKATVMAKEDCHCIVVSSLAFHAILADNPDLAEKLSELLVKRSGELENIRNSTVSEKEKAEAEVAARHKIKNKIRHFFKMK